jgi:hypothetical protein
MACAPRDILIEQVQTAPIQMFSPATNPTPTYDIRFSHAVKGLFFTARLTTIPSEWSNYTTEAVDPQTGLSSGSDPIITTSLVYENNQRLNAMGSDYYSLIQPYYHIEAIPEETGYHMYSYSLRMDNIDPMGSTNYGKLTNVSISPTASADAIASAPEATYQFIVTCVNNNIIRISGGALGFPVL